MQSDARFLYTVKLVVKWAGARNMYLLCLHTMMTAMSRHTAMTHVADTTPIPTTTHTHRHTWTSMRRCNIAQSSERSILGYSMCLSKNVLVCLHVWDELLPIHSGICSVASSTDSSVDDVMILSSAGNMTPSTTTVTSTAFNIVTRLTNAHCQHRFCAVSRYCKFIFKRVA